MTTIADFAARSDRPINEADRLQALERLMLLDSDPDVDFDLLTRLAAELCDAPFALVTLVDADRTWVKSAHGLNAGQLPRSHSYCSVALTEQDPLLHVPDVAVDLRTAHIKPPGLPEQGLYAGVALQTAEGFRLGTLCVLDSRCRELDGCQIDTLRGLAGQVVKLIELHATRRELERATRTDPLTGLANRRALAQRLLEEAERCSRYGTAFSVVLVDFDHFRAINDSRGNEAGDVVLSNAADLLRAMLRNADFAARYGGNEFCVVLPHADARGALTWCEHYRLRLAEFDHRHQCASFRATISLGVACAPGNTQPSIRALLQAAGDALAQAKYSGRNRTELAE